MKTWRILAVAALALVGCASPARPPQPPAAPLAPEAGAARYLDEVRDQPPLLLAFLRRLPKGGDLHNHLSGAVYAESLIAWGSESGLCIERKTYRIGARPCSSDRPPLAEAVKDPAFYAATIDALAAAVEPGMRQRVDIGEQFGMRREPQIGIVGEDLAEGVAQGELRRLLSLLRVLHKDPPDMCM